MKPIFNVTIAGQQIDVQDRLVSMEIIDRADTKSDSLSLTLSDADNRLALPRHGVELYASMGYEHSGLVNKGTFLVDDVEYSAPPNTLTIRAHAANFRSGFKERREESYHHITLGDILRRLCVRAELTLSIASALDSTFINHIDQTESDSFFMYRLGRLYDATATIKQGRMVFMPKGQGQQVSGAALPSVTITAQDCTNWRLSIADREHEITGVRAKYVDRKEGNTLTTTAGEATNTITLPQSFPNQSEAYAAANAELTRRKRGGQKISLTLSAGNPAIIAEQPITLTGFKSGVDGPGWIAEEVTHTLGTGGLSSRVELAVK